MLKLRLIISVVILTAIMTGCAGTNTALTVAMLIKQSQNLETEDTATAEVSADDIRSGYFIIDGVTYKLPLDCQEFLNRGWVLAANSEAQLEPGDYLNTKLKKGDGVLSIKIGNSGDEKKTITSLPIIEMSIDLTWDPEAPTSSSPRPDEQEKTLPTVELPKGVVLLTGKKTDVIEATKNGSNRGIEDIIDTYGEDDISKMPWPSPYIEDEYGYVNPTDNSSIIFSMSYVAFNADPTTKRHISSVTIVNDSAFVNKRTQIMEAGAEIAEPTTEVAAYQIPAELGTDITSGIIELEEIYTSYRLRLLHIRKMAGNLKLNFLLSLNRGIMHGYSCLETGSNLAYGSTIRERRQLLTVIAIFLV